MKNKIFGIIMLIPFLGFGQLQSGDILIESNYGFIGGKGLWGAIVEEFGSEVELVGPATFRFQYMTSDKFGIGLDFNYTSRSSSVNNVAFQDRIKGLTDYFDADINQKITRIMVRFSWEFVNDEKIQMNWANSIGYRTAPWDFTVTTDDESASLSDVVDVGDGWPLAFRTAIGLRYLFTDNIGLNMDLIGLSGGAFMNAGLSFKL